MANITNNDITFGIEIETVGISKQALAEAIQSVTGGNIQRGRFVVTPDGREWKVVSDGSINSPNGYAGEIVSPICRIGDLEQVQDIVRAVRRAGARVNSSCGIHIHCGSDAFGHEGKNPAKTLRNLVKICHKNDELISAALGMNPSRRNRWCKPVSTDLVDRIDADRNLTLDRLNVHWYGRANRYPSHYDSTRYHGVNLHNVWFRGTVEYRWFEATLHAGEVKAYIQFALALTAKAINARGASATKRPLRSESAKYDFRCFLLSLGLIGDEYKTCRLHLTKRLSGSAAWKNGRPAGR